MNLTFEELRKTNIKRCEAVFHKLSEWSPTDWACAMAGEAGEVCNAIKKLKRMENNTNTQKDFQTKEEAIICIGKEIADTIIYLDLLAARLDIDLSDVVRNKFNEVSNRMNSNIYL